MDCRLGCGACCISPSISSPIPGMPKGKPAGERCIQLNDIEIKKIKVSKLKKWHVGGTTTYYILLISEI